MFQKNMSKTGPRRNDVPRSIIYLAIIFIGTGLGFNEAAARYWSDSATGIAIGGFDPLAYFTSQEERIGTANHEVTWRGLVWRFANEGNKAAFMAAPLIYAPQFGGFGLVSVSRGLPAIGNPRIWAIHEDRLYFFHSHALRTIWESNVEQTILEARAKWTILEPLTRE